MAIRFTCRVCHTVLAAQDGFAGHLVNCPRCKASVRVPGFPGPTTLEPVEEPPFVEPLPEPASRPHRRRQRRRTDDSPEPTSAGDIAFGVSCGILTAIFFVCAGCLLLYLLGLYVLKWVQEGGP